VAADGEVLTAHNAGVGVHVDPNTLRPA